MLRRAGRGEYWRGRGLYATSVSDILKVVAYRRCAVACVEIYTKSLCPYCARAKALLKAKGAAFEEYDISMGGAGRTRMIERSGGGTTVPQIFIDDRAIGGSDDLAALDRSGRLDALLAA